MDHVSLVNLGRWSSKEYFFFFFFFFFFLPRYIEIGPMISDEKIFEVFCIDIQGK